MNLIYEKIKHGDEEHKRWLLEKSEELIKELKLDFGFSEYQKQAMALRLDRAWAPQYAVNGLPGEVGELLSVFAKAIRDGEKDDHLTMVKKELGDILWFVAAIAQDNNLDLEDVASENIRKLVDRKDRGVLQGSGDNR